MKPGFLLTICVLGPLAIGLAACSREQSLICGRDSLYLDAETVRPLQIPDDLSLPDASDSLRIPQAGIAEEAVEPDGCLEHSPAFRDAE
jgi:uncharacterized lipoprotein